MPSSTAELEPIFQSHIQTLALTLRPQTIRNYRGAARRFLSYLRTAHPQLRHLSQIRRNPHLLGWMRSLCEQQPPLSNRSRILLLIYTRRLLEDLAAQGHPLSPDLIRPEDFPPAPHYLPRPLAPQDDQLLQRELRRIDDLPANALLLTRATGIRIGECIDLALDCLRQIGPDQWALHVPIGKLHNQRLVPADAETCRMVARILVLRALASQEDLARSQGLLLPRSASHDALYQWLRRELLAAARRAGCSGPVTPHSLRHSFASEMVRFGISLPALMQLLGHKDIRMTMRYVEVTQQDLQHQFHAARQNAARPHRVPALSVPTAPTSAGLSGIRQALTATRHLLEMYRRHLANEKTQRILRRLDHRLLAVASKLDQLATAEE
jgi:site-specific recombinase XerD